MSKEFLSTQMFVNLTRVESVLEDDGLTKTATILARERDKVRAMYEALVSITEKLADCYVENSAADADPEIVKARAALALARGEKP